WREDAGRLAVCLGDAATDGPAASLDEGVREVLCPTGEPGEPAWTCRLEFDRAAGWTRPRAEDWLWSHLHVRDLPRPALREARPRMTAALAAVLSDGFLTPPFRVPAPGAGGVALEFVAVPPLAPERAPRRPADRGKDRQAQAARPGAAPRA